MQCLIVLISGHGVQNAVERPVGEERALVKLSFPEKYRNPETSDVTIEVPSSGRTCELNITSK